MEVKQMAKFIELEANGKKYYVGFSNRASVLNAKRNGLEEVIKDFGTDKSDADEIFSKILRYGMLEKQPEITVEETRAIVDEYISENVDDTYCVDIMEIMKFITDQYQAFSGLPVGTKKVRKLKIVEQ